MRAHTRRLLIVAGVTLFASALPLVSAHAALQGPAQWHTCVPQATSDYREYQRTNDIFTGKLGVSCISADKNTLTINRNYIAQPGGVVAYPAVRVGIYPYNRQPVAGFPAPVGSARMNITGTLRGDDRYSTTIGDFDLWFAKPGSPTVHVAEMIVVYRWHNYRAAGGVPVKIGTRHYRVSMWHTGPAGHQWPIVRVISRVQHDQLTIGVHQLLQAARAHDSGAITSTDVLSSVSNGWEVWHGGRNLSVALSVRVLR